MSSKLLSSTYKIVYGRDAGRCSLCKCELIREGEDSKLFHIGKIAHIEGEKPGSARYNINSDDKYRNSPKNLMLACPTHHEEIDIDTSTFTVEELAKKQKIHIGWVNRQLSQGLVSTTFEELAVTIKYIISSPSDGKEDFNITKPLQKINRNNLSEETANLITMGMARVGLVKEYLNSNPDVHFADRLKTGLQNKYQELRNKNQGGDEIFVELFSYASNNSADFKHQSATLCILAYFFERCDIFEK